MRHAIPRRGRTTEHNSKENRGLSDSIFPEYLDKEVYESQGYYDNEEDGRAGNDNYNGRERNKDSAQQHEHSSWQSLVYHVDVLGEAVDDTSYRRGVKERLRRVKFVEE